MTDDMASLKQAMDQMDAEDPTVAQAGKDRAALILSEARLSFAKLAELIQQRRLLLQPAILARIKRMDQPGMLGDAAFRDTGSALRKEGQNFLQIAEAIEASGKLAPRDRQQMSDPLHQIASEPSYPAPSEPGSSRWLKALTMVVGIALLPLRHPLRFLAIILFAAVLFYAARGVVAVSQQVSAFVDGVATIRHGADTALSSAGSFINERVLRQVQGGAADAPRPDPVSFGRGPVAAVRNLVGCCSCHRGSPRNRACSFRKCSSRTALGGPRTTSTGRPCRTAGCNAAPRRKGCCAPFKVGCELCAGRGSLFRVSSLRAARRQSSARIRDNDAGWDPPPIPHGGAMYRWRRRLLLGRRSILTCCAALPANRHSPDRPRGPGEFIVQIPSFLAAPASPENALSTRSAEFGLERAFQTGVTGFQQHGFDLAVTIARCEDRGRVAKFVAGSRIGSTGKQLFHDFDVTAIRGPHQGRAVDDVPCVAVGVMGKQNFDRLHSAVPRRAQQRGLAVLVLLVDIGSALEKHLHQFGVASVRGKHQRGVAVAVARTHIGSLIQLRYQCLCVATIRSRDHRFRGIIGLLRLISAHGNPLIVGPVVERPGIYEPHFCNQEESEEPVSPTVVLRIHYCQEATICAEFRPAIAFSCTATTHNSIARTAPSHESPSSGYGHVPGAMAVSGVRSSGNLLNLLHLLA